jgi:hypothetical protein
MKPMDQFYTELIPTDFRPKITFGDHIIMAGSCFSEHIAEKLLRFKYRVLSNPFGILYNPASLSESFRRIASRKYYDLQELVQHEELYHTMDHHGSWSDADPLLVIDRINKEIDTTYEHLKQSKFIFISLGTAHVFKYLTTGRIAGNNHKLPPSNFEASRMTMDECLQALEVMSTNIRQVAPNAHIIWTVSPVRHLRDGFIENQRSKSTLLLAIDEMISRHTDHTYFPAYEIMMDQLRDYRFYARDMIHPSVEAVDVIWDYFGETYLDHQDLQVHPSIERVKKAMEHRFLHKNQAAIKSFAEAQLRQITQIEAFAPDLDLKMERQHFFNLIEPD